MVDQSKLAAQTDAVFKSSRGYAEGGMPEDVDIQRVDPVSGNEVPPGSLPAEVRDDIPAQLSEGEYVVPADVVRYYGVKFFEDLRADAKMGWDAMDQNGRIGGEPMTPPGMEMGDDELPFDLSELNFVEVSDDVVSGMAEGGFWASVRKALGADKRPSTKEIMERRAKEREALDKFAKGDKSSSSSKSSSSKSSSSKSSSSKSSWGDASDNKPYQGMTQSMRDTFAVNKGPGMMETLSGFVPEMPNFWGSENDFTAREREAAKTRKGTNLLKGYADGGYAKSEGDPGYETEGALGLGIEGLTLGGGLDLRKYENAAGDVIYVPFINGEPQIDIPEGYYPMGQVPVEEAPAASEAESAVSMEPSAGDDDGYTKPMESINFKELSNEELAEMLKQQQSLTSSTIAGVAGVINPIMGIAVKFAMYDTAKRVKRELERRMADPDIPAEEKTQIAAMLEVANKDEPSLLKRLFTKTKEAVEDIVDPQERVETNQGPSTRARRNPLTGSAKEPTSAGVPEPSPITVEELPPALTGQGLEIGMEDGPVVYNRGQPVMRFPTVEQAQQYIDENKGLLPSGITYDDLLMGQESPVTKTLSLDDIVSKAEEAISSAANVRDTAIKKGMELGKDFDLKETIAKLETDPFFFLKTITPEAYTPSPTVPRVATPKVKSASTKDTATQTRDTATQSASLGAPKKTSSNVGDDTNWTSVRNEAKKSSAQAISNARKNLATSEEIADIKAAANRVDSYLKDKESGRNTTGVTGFAEGGMATEPYTSLDALKDIQKLNQYN